MVKPVVPALQELGLRGITGNESFVELTAHDDNGRSDRYRQTGFVVSLYSGDGLRPDNAIVLGTNCPLQEQDGLAWAVIYRRIEDSQIDRTREFVCMYSLPVAKPIDVSNLSGVNANDRLSIAPSPYPVVVIDRLRDAMICRASAICTIEDIAALSFQYELQALIESTHGNLRSLYSVVA